ncbi:MAG: nitric oxide synthase, partial [Firmicutes bacterium]|nr:nitric oxide synthase [Bacillota bacterium]
VCEGLTQGGADVVKKSIAEAGEEIYFDYDLVCLGFPSIHWHVPVPLEKFLKENFRKHQKEGRIVPGAPSIGKDLLVFCTYCGAHTGIREAIPAAQYAAQYFEHVGFTTADEWYIVGEYVGNEPNNTLGRLGNICGQPDASELERVRSAACNLAHRLQTQRQY